jgi:fucose permease
MTAISLMQSRRHAASRSAALSRLNLIWSLGACLAPAILLRGAARWGLDSVLRAAAGLFLLLALAAWLLLQEVPVPAPERTPASAPSPARLAMGASLALLVVIAMSTGVEASLGGWLTTYSRRSGLMTSGVVDTITCLWIGLLLGRLVQSFRQVAQWGERRILAAIPWLLCAALSGLLIAHQGWSMSGCALLAGFALGPAYPLSLALWLEQGERGNLAFLIAGCGSSALPLLTGVVSDATHSLTCGLLVPFAGACAMAIMAVAATYRLRQTATNPAAPLE